MQTNGGAGRGLAAMGAVLAALAIGLSAYAAHGVADAQARVAPITRSSRSSARGGTSGWPPRRSCRGSRAMWWRSIWPI